MTTPLQKVDDKHVRETGVKPAYKVTPVSDDSPRIISQVNTGNAKQKPITPVNNGTRDGYYDVENSKDKNLRTQFIKPNQIG